MKALLTPAEADEALRALLRATLTNESILAARDAQIAAIQTRHSFDLAESEAEIASIEQVLEAYYTEHPPTGQKSIQLAHGLIGMRSPSNPALVPLDKWDWEKVARKLKAAFKTRFFHKPKAPAIDKVKIKRELSAEQLAKVGLQLDTTESFYIELNRLDVAEKKAA
jgi:Bacteriophage Mu Gam like protein